MAVRTKAAGVVARLSNEDIVNIARSKSPTFASHTAKVTSDFFTERGWGTIKSKNWQQWTNELLGGIMPFVFERMDRTQFVDTIAEQGFGETVYEPMGEFIERITLAQHTPISPQYRNLKDGDNPDQFAYRGVTINQRFFDSNFDYQDLLSLVDEWDMKRLFLATYGLSELVSAIYEAVYNTYTAQTYLNKIEAINHGLNDTEVPLQATQTYHVDMPTDYFTATEEQIVSTLKTIRAVVSNMTKVMATGAFNSYNYPVKQNISDLCLVTRFDLTGAIGLIAARNTFNKEYLAIPEGIKIIEIPYFGYIATSDGTTPVYPVYGSKFGDVKGFSTVEGAAEPTIKPEDVVYVDKNPNVPFFLADRRWLLHIIRNPFTIEVARNKLGKYNNLIASAPNNSLKYDRLYNFVKFDNTPTTGG